MKEKIFIALLLATIAYLIIVISGIVMDFSLETILFKGVIGVIIIAIVSFIFISIIETNVLVEEGETEIGLVEDETEPDSKEGHTMAELAADFSPLEVPIVEGSEEEKDDE